ncbi:MAG TPA: MFS transporter [Paraburkholderia sp.]|jgi:MFS family permease
MKIAVESSPMLEEQGLSWRQIRTIAISMLGGALEYYEFMVFIFMVPVLGQLFFASATLPWVRQLQTLAIFALGYIVRPFGGIVLGALGDKLGRKRMFIVTLALMAVPTFCIGLLPTYAQIGVAAPLLLLLCRLCQGLAMAGETPTALTFVIEHVDEKRTGFAIGLMGAGLIGGMLIGIFTISTMDASFTKDEIAHFWWRLPFLLGGVFGLISAALRRLVSETPVFEEMMRRRSVDNFVPFRELITRYRPELLVAFLSSFVGGAIIQSVQLFPAIFFQTHFQFPAALVNRGQTISTVVTFFSIIIGNWLIDRIGWMVGISVAAAGIVGAVILLYWNPQVSTLTLHMAIAGIPCALVIMLHNLLTRVFPAEIRITGISTAHNTASAVAGGIMPVTMGFLVHYHYWAAAWVPSLFALLAVVITPIAMKRRKPLRFQP